MKQLCFDTEKKYDVRICRSVSELTPEDMAPVVGRSDDRRVFVLCDENTARLHFSAVGALIGRCGGEPFPIILPAGEGTKSADSYLRVCAALLENGCGRGGCLINLGGGMIGDLGGFAASTYMRGIRFAGFPTTLLSMVDSSLGGKTGIDLNGVKNVLGVFGFPEAVYICTDFLDTLPESEFRSGMGEVIKYAAMDGFGLLDGIESFGDVNEELILRCCRIKRSFVVGDEHDNGRRRILNLGHSFGHAFEAASGFSLSHGEAVGLGLLAVSDFGEQLGITEGGTSDKLRSLLLRFGMAADYAPYARPAVPYLRHDKKLGGSELDMVFIRRFGSPLRRRIPVKAAESFLLAGHAGHIPPGGGSLY